MEKLYKRDELIEYALSAGLNEQDAINYAENMLHPVISNELSECYDSLYEELRNGEWDFQ